MTSRWSVHTQHICLTILARQEAKRQAELAREETARRLAILKDQTRQRKRARANSLASTVVVSDNDSVQDELGDAFAGM